MPTPANGVRRPSQVRRSSRRTCVDLAAHVAREVLGVAARGRAPTISATALPVPSASTPKRGGRAARRSARLEDPVHPADEGPVAAAREDGAVAGARRPPRRCALASSWLRREEEVLVRDDEREGARARRAFTAFAFALRSTATSGRPRRRAPRRARAGCFALATIRSIVSPARAVTRVSWF